MKSRWYKDAVIYQIYPRSFCDGNGDGIGDIRGIISKLDYLQQLGVDAVWLSPCYKSPNDDNGYDISDYRDIMDEFGTLDDWQEMIDGMHARGIKLIMDLVVNHSSDEHEWFKQSRSSKDNPYRDYYIWRKGRGKDGRKPPNNWRGNFLGKAWEYDEKTGEWYMHLFSKKQPDLNWDNPKVRQEVVDICNYWFEKGVDGFRCDVITYISKNQGLPDGKNPLNPLRGIEYYCLGENWEKYIEQVNRDSWSKYDSLIVGECAGINYEQAKSIADETKPVLDTLFNFEHTYVDFVGKFKLSRYKKIVSKYQRIPATVWTSNYLENHDQPRCIPRYVEDSEEYRKYGATMLATVNFMLRGTPYIYQGQEIGMTSCPFEEDEYKDIMSLNVIKMLDKHKIIKKLGMKILSKKARDNARTPMQWNAEENAGFSTAKPWMKVNPNYLQINVEKDRNSDFSVFEFYKNLIAKRKQINDILSDGTWQEYYEKSNQVWVFSRKLGESYVYVEANFGRELVEIDDRYTMDTTDAELFVCNYKYCETNVHKHTLRPYEARVYVKK
ncbi:MAG: alpha-glucosidase [Christensenellales bacterium]